MEPVDNSEQTYRPPSWGWRIVRAHLDVTVKPTITDRCKDADISRSTFYSELEKPEFVRWFNRMLMEAVISDSSDVRQSHLRLCLNGNLEAIKLWYERYGDFIPSQRHILDADVGIESISESKLLSITRILEGESQEGMGPSFRQGLLPDLSQSSLQQGVRRAPPGSVSDDRPTSKE